MFQLFALPPQLCPLSHSLNAKFLELLISEQLDGWYEYLHKIRLTIQEMFLPIKGGGGHCLGNKLNGDLNYPVKG